jgi:molybdopterin converting factor small subunit
MRVEFYGIPRARAGVAAIDITEPRLTLGDLLQQLAAQFPEFGRDCLRDGKLAPQYLANLDGSRFVRDNSTSLADVQSVLILSADPGG